MFHKPNLHVHFVGIGGIGMSGIAEVLTRMGYAVTGTDQNHSETTRRLSGLGATIHLGHDARYLSDADVVVISSAIKADNPEVQAAKSRHIPVIPRAEMLGELMRLKQGIAIAGAHGKTTTTSLIAAALHEAGVDPTVVIGGKVDLFDSNARLGGGDILVAEADESDGSFSWLSPMLAVITNLDAEHLDHYGSMERLQDAFVSFAGRVPFYGATIVCADDARLMALTPRLNKRVITYGFHEQADFRATNIHHDGLLTRFDLTVRGEAWGDYALRMPGVHNVQNAVAAIAVCDFMEADRSTVRAALLQFSGVERRFSVRGEAKGVLVIDDYAHHPTEIAATLTGARTSFPGRRIIAVVQPHRYTRLRDHMDGFVDALALADNVFVTDVYSAGEPPILGIDSTALTDRLSRAGAHATHLPALAELPAHLAAFVRPGDVVLTLGAGSITKTGPALLSALTAP